MYKITFGCMFFNFLFYIILYIFTVKNAIQMQYFGIHTVLLVLFDYFFKVNIFFIGIIDILSHYCFFIITVDESK